MEILPVSTSNNTAVFPMVAAASPRQKSIGKGSQGKKPVVAPKPACVEVSDESNPEPTRRKTGKRSSTSVVIKDTPTVLNKTSLDQPKKLEGIQMLTAKEQLAADTMQAIKNSKKPSRSQPHAGGSSEGTVITLGVPNESTNTFKTLSEGTSIKPRVPNEVQGDKKDDDEDEDDDRSIDIKDTNDDERIDDEYAEYEAHDDEYVHDNVDEEMRNVEVAETREDDEMTDVTKAYVEKTEEEKGDDEPAGNEVANADQATYTTVQDNQVPNIQSLSMLIVPILVIPEPTVLSPIPEITNVTPITTAPPKAPTITAITTTLTPTPIKTPLPSPPIFTVAPTTALVMKLEAFSAIHQKVFELEQDVQELKQVDNSLEILASIRSQVLSAVNEYLGSSLGDALQKAKQEHAAKEQLLKQSAKPYDQIAEAKFNQKGILFNMMRESKKRCREDKEEDPSSGSNQEQRKRISGKESKSLNPSLTSKKTSKGNNSPKSSKTGKSASDAKTVEEATHEVTIGDEELGQENVNDADQPQDDSVPMSDTATKNDWFKQPPV
uniref:Uncharacterized protein n=1 Tax=Tanacetum cinerariifolium TaxID=118510 RepID=A0A6L2KK57_TANCI|nr:hypothetical protein [Tanacetum cinerariifolium]